MQYRKYDTSARKLKTNASTVRHLGLLNNSGKKEKANSDSSQEDLAHVTLFNKNGSLAGNASLSLDEVFYILAMKLAYREEITLCYKSRPSDDLFSGLLKSSKKKRHLLLLQKGPN